MLYEKECTVGVDAVIGKLAKDLFLELLNSAGWRDYDSFPRIYLNKRGDDTIPEQYLGCGEYKEVLFNDTKTVNSFFMADEKAQYDDKEFIYTQDAAFIVQANLKKLYPKITTRADEELINDVRKAIWSKRWDMRLTKTITGVDNVYASLKLKADRKYFDNIGSFCIARFNFTLKYYLAQKKTQILQ